MTPELPDWIRDYRCPKGRFRNIYEYVPDETRLYGTESMFGDWDGELLLLGQEFACTDEVERWIAEGRERVYAHDPERITSRNIARLTRGFDCGMLCGSALAGMLRVGHANSGLPGWSHMSDHLCAVLRFTLDRMPNVSAIACMGSVAWELCHRAFDAEFQPLTHALMYQCPSRLNGLRVYALPHATRSGEALEGKQRVRERWAWMRADLLGTPPRAAA